MWGFVVWYRVSEDTIREKLIEIDGQFFDGDFEIWNYALVQAKKYLESIMLNIGALEKLEFLYC